LPHIEPLVTAGDRLTAVAERLARAGFVAAEEEAAELIEAAAGNDERLGDFVARRVEGEPLPWLTGFVLFSGHRICVDRGVYVPRPQTEPMVQQAIDRLPENGLAADLATGCGAVAVALHRARPQARVLATDVDEIACRCAASNGVEVYQGHLAQPLPRSLDGRFDVVTAVVPYVPTDELRFLPRDVQRFEPRLALDGGPDGTRLLEETVWSASALLRPGGTLLLELGGTQDQALAPVLAAAGFRLTHRIEDDDGDLRGVEATRLEGGSPPTSPG
jgi:release factor glutamine methyltransferase